MLIQLIIIQIVTFLAIVIVLKRLLYTETAKEAKRLKVLKEETVQRQRELNEKIEAAEKAYNEKMAQAQAEARKLRSRLEEEIAEQRKNIIDKARESAEQMKKTALNAKEKIREEALLQMEERIPTRAVQLFKETLSDNAREVAHRELVGKVVSEIEKLDKSRFKVRGDKAECICAYPLGRAGRNKLASSLSEKLDRKIELDEKQDKRLVAGVIIRLGEFIIDGSLENNLRRVKA